MNCCIHTIKCKISFDIKRPTSRKYRNLKKSDWKTIKVPQHEVPSPASRALTPASQPQLRLLAASASGKANSMNLCQWL